MKKIFFIILAVIVVILVFSLGTFGVEAESVLSGYENTRRYAQDAKMLTVAVDTYKETVQVKLNDEERRKNAVPDEVESLGAYGKLLSDEDYEKYTEGVYMYADVKYYWEGTSPIKQDKSLAAKMNTVNEWSETPNIINYLTDTNLSCKTAGTKEIAIDNGETIQCAAFADIYTNQTTYKEIVITGGYNVQNKIYNYTDTCWKSETGVYLNTAEEAINFFTDVTPGTFIRTKDRGHSYIILGADTNEIVFYDCNSHHDCGICLHKCTWDEFVNNYKSAWASSIILVISPPNTQLPQGCQDNFGAVGDIINAKEATN